MQWDPAGPIAVLDAEVATHMLNLGYASHPSAELVAEYNGLIEEATTGPELPPTPVASDVWAPPEGWLAHPSAPGYYYKGTEVLTEAQLRALA